MFNQLKKIDVYLLNTRPTLGNFFSKFDY